MMRRTDEGAEKCALRDFLRDADTAADFFIVESGLVGTTKTVCFSEACP